MNCVKHILVAISVITLVTNSLSAAVKAAHSINVANCIADIVEDNTERILKKFVNDQEALPSSVKLTDFESSWNNKDLCRLMFQMALRFYPSINDLFAPIAMPPVLNLGHSEEIRGIISADRIITAYPDGKSLFIRDIKQGKSYELSEHTQAITDIALNPSGSFFISGSLDTNAKKWDSTTGKCLLTLSHGQAIKCVATNNNHIITGSIDHTVKIWDAQTGKCLFTLVGHTKPITTVAISPCGNYVITGSNMDKTIRIWNIHDGKSQHTITTNNGIIKKVFTIAPLTLIEYTDGTIESMALSNGTTEKPYQGHYQALSPEGRFYIIGSKDSTTKLLLDQQLIHLLDGDKYSYKFSLQSAESIKALSPCGRFLATSSDKGITILDLAWYQDLSIQEFILAIKLNELRINKPHHLILNGKMFLIIYPKA